MLPKAPPPATSALALQTTAVQSQARLAGDPLGQSGSRDTLAQLTAAMAELKAMAVQPMLNRAVEAINGNDLPTAAKLVNDALAKDENNGFGWYLNGVVCERSGDFGNSILAYEKALGLLPDQVIIANDLGRLAYRMDMKPTAEKLFRHFLAANPTNYEAVNNLACAVRDQHRYDEAIDLLRPAIVANPGQVQLWNTMGTVTAEQGDFTSAELFFTEALRLDPDYYKSRYNRANALVALGDGETAIQECAAALAYSMPDDERQMMRISHSAMLMCQGRIREGWEEYEARLNPSYGDCTYFLFEQPKWQPGDDLRGKSLMIVGEQGLGDEILFANILPDIIERLGPDGRLTLVVEPRLIPMFQRSYPQARVGGHATYTMLAKTIRYAPFMMGDLDSIDLWAPIATMMLEYRPTVDSFPSHAGYITPDPERVAYWRKVLEEQAPPGPKIGLLWKSAIKKNARHRFFSPFETWAPILKTQGASFINLQYGDCSEEIAQAKRDLGVDIWTPPGIDLKQDLDDVLALSCAMDLVIGFANATLNIAAAAGVPTWLISTPGAWGRMGTARYPWYPQLRVFAPQAFGDWTPVMESVGDAFASYIAER